MRIAGGFARYGPQAEALRGVVGGRFQPSVIESKALGLAVLEEQLAIIGPMKCLVDKALDPVPLHARLGEKQVFLAGHGFRSVLGVWATEYIGTLRASVTRRSEEIREASTGDKAPAWHLVAMTQLPYPD